MTFAKDAPTPAAALDRILAALRDQPFEDLGFAKVDHHRAIRQGFPEVILGLGKTPSQIATIAAEIVRQAIRCSSLARMRRLGKR